MTADPWPHTYDLGYKDATTGEPISDQQAGEPFHDRRGITGMWSRWLNRAHLRLCPICRNDRPC